MATCSVESLEWEDTLQSHQRSIQNGQRLGEGGQAGLGTSAEGCKDKFKKRCTERRGDRVLDVALRCCTCRAGRKVDVDPLLL